LSQVEREPGIARIPICLPEHLTYPAKIESIYSNSRTSLDHSSQKQGTVARKSEVGNDTIRLWKRVPGS
jgi:hypothetical protein